MRKLLQPLLPLLGLDKRLDERGHEKLDNTPIEIPLEFRETETLEERIKRLLRSEQFAREMDRQGYETYEEADDFDVGDDYDPKSPWEIPADNYEQEAPVQPPKQQTAPKEQKTQESPKAKPKVNKQRVEKAPPMEPDDSFDQEPT